MSTGSSTQARPTRARCRPGSVRTRPGGRRRHRRAASPAADARIRSKLALILFVPLLAVLALATVRLVDVGGRRPRRRPGRGPDPALHRRLRPDAVPAQGADGRGAVPRRRRTPTPDALQRRDRAERRADPGVQRRPRASSTTRRPPCRTGWPRIDDHLQHDGRDPDQGHRPRRDRRLRGGAALRRRDHRPGRLRRGAEPVRRRRRASPTACARSSAFARAKAGTAEQEAISYAARVSGDASAEQQLRLHRHPDRPAGGADRVLAGRHAGAAGPGRQHGHRRRGQPGRPGGHPAQPRASRSPPIEITQSLRRGRRPDALGRAAARVAGRSPQAADESAVGHPAGRHRGGAGAARR